MLDPAETQMRRHLWLTLLAVLALVVAVTLTLIAGRGQNPGSATIQLVSGTLKVSTLESAHLACPSDPTFSPDGSRLVVFGVLTTSLPPGSSCSTLAIGNTTAAYAYAIFDTQSGQPLRVMSLDSKLLEQLGGLTDEDAPQFAYSSLGWSPDGTHVAFAFTAFASAARTPESVLDSGLLLLDASSGRMTVIRGDSGFFSAASGLSAGFPVWHVAQGSELPSFLPSPALSYSWSQDGVPQPLLPLSGPLAQLPAEAGSHYPVGAPDGGSRFTLWQPGLVIGAASLGGGSAQSAFVTAFPAWSPDGADVHADGRWRHARRLGTAIRARVRWRSTVTTAAAPRGASHRPRARCGARRGADAGGRRRLGCRRVERRRDVAGQHELLRQRRPASGDPRYDDRRAAGARAIHAAAG